jgi:hypothetical protein
MYISISGSSGKLGANLSAYLRACEALKLVVVTRFVLLQLLVSPSAALWKKSGTV